VRRVNVFLQSALQFQTKGGLPDDFYSAFCIRDPLRVGGIYHAIELQLHCDDWIPESAQLFTSGNVLPHFHLGHLQAALHLDVGD
jgi:hypothetical protein